MGTAQEGVTLVTPEAVMEALKPDAGQLFGVESEEQWQVCAAAAAAAARTMSILPACQVLISWASSFWNPVAISCCTLAAALCRVFAAHYTSCCARRGPATSLSDCCVPASGDHSRNDAGRGLGAASPVRAAQYQGF